MRPNIGSIAPPTGTLLSATHYQCLPSWGATVIGPGIHIGRLMTLYCLFVLGLFFRLMAREVNLHICTFTVYKNNVSDSHSVLKYYSRPEL